MIADLHIRNLGVIAESELEFSSGMVAFTGETGAGKTMLVGALGLVLGDRADTGVVTGGKAEVSARIVVDPGGPTAARVEEAGGAVDPDGTLAVSRTVSAVGRGRAALGGAAVPVSLLAEVGRQTAQRHSQSDQVQLRSPRRQRQSLDAYGGAPLGAALADYRRRYTEYLESSRQLASLQQQRSEREARMAELREGLARIDAVDPEPDEDQSLPAGIARLANAEELAHSVAAVLAVLERGDGDGILTDLTVAQQSLARTVAMDPGRSGLTQRLDEAAILLADIAAELRSYAGDLHTDPVRLEEMQQRRSAVSALQRSFGPGTADVVRWAQQAREELARLDGADEAEANLRDDIDRKVGELAAAAQRVSDMRTDAARRLGAAVTAELVQLAMPHAVFTATVAQHEANAGLPLPDGRVVAFGENGIDTVAFLLAPHDGASPAPIGEGASGGELSRIMLALEVVLAESDPPAVFVFDEVDAGIGGRTAVEVGRRLARLARRSQVLVVTHLPQVAVFADQHVVVRKDSDGQVTRSSVMAVGGLDRRRELARMLSGQDESEVALAHADELLAVAAQDSPASALG